LLQFVGKRLRFEGSSLRSRDEQYQGKLRDQLHDHALPKFKGGSFKVLIEKVFDWKDIQDAHRLMESNKVSYHTFDERSCERLLISSRIDEGKDHMYRVLESDCFCCTRTASPQCIEDIAIEECPGRAELPSNVLALPGDL